jgi:hypothetical protein
MQDGQKSGDRSPGTDSRSKIADERDQADARAGQKNSRQFFGHFGRYFDLYCVISYFILIVVHRILQEFLGNREGNAAVGRPARQ